MDNSLPLIDETDHEILMHRDAHFGGSFKAMLEYYQNEGKGCSWNIEPKQIERLDQFEKKMQQNLSEVCLSEAEKDIVERAKEKYLTLRDVYGASDDIPKLIADLILSEEEEPSQEIAALVAKGPLAVDALIGLIKSEEFYDPLFPGYGLAPAYAAHCLGLIGDAKAVVPLFEAFKNEDFFLEENIIDALNLLGEKSKPFLLKSLCQLPITRTNEYAAIALMGFTEDPEVSHHFLKMLQNEQSFSLPTFATYLILGCSHLSNAEDREAFLSLSKHFPPDLERDAKTIIQKWNHKKV